MGSEKAFLLSVIYKGRKISTGGAAAVEAPGEVEKTPPQGAGPAVEAPPGGVEKTPPQGAAARLWKPRAAAPRRELIQPHARRVVNLDT